MLGRYECTVYPTHLMASLVKTVFMLEVFSNGNIYKGVSVLWFNPGGGFCILGFLTVLVKVNGTNGIKDTRPNFHLI